MILWLFLASASFNVYAVSKDWSTEDPTLLMINTVFIFSVWILIVYSVLRCIYARLPRITASVNDKPALTVTHENASLKNCSIAEWTAAFEKLAKNMPQREMTCETHGPACNCHATCFRISTRCRVDVDNRMHASAAANDTIRQVSQLYKRLTMVQHDAECNCDCFALN